MPALSILTPEQFESAPALYDASALLIDASIDVIHHLGLGEPTGFTKREEAVPGLQRFLVEKAEPRAQEFAKFVGSGRPVAIMLSRHVFLPGTDLGFSSWHWWARSVAEEWIYAVYPAAVDSRVARIDHLQPMSGAYRMGEPASAVLRSDPMSGDPAWTVVVATEGEPVCVILPDHANVAVLAGWPEGGVDAVLAALDGWAATSTPVIWESTERRAAADARQRAEEQLGRLRQEEAAVAERDQRLLERPELARAVELYRLAAAALPDTAAVATHLFDLFEVAEEILGVGSAQLHTILPISNNAERRLRKTANHPPYNARHKSVRSEAPTTTPELLLRDGRTVLRGLLDELVRRKA